MKKQVIMLIALILALGMFFSLARGGSETPTSSGQLAKVMVRDSQERQVTVNCPPERVVVLSQYIAEIIKGLGEERRVVGIDEYSKRNTRWPSYVLQLPSVGQGANFDVEKIISLQPDLVLGRNLKPEIQAKLQQAGIPYLCVYGYKVKKLPEEIRLLGRVFQQEAKAEEYAGFIEEHWKSVRERVENLPPEKKPRVYWESSQGDYSTYGEDSGAGPLIRWAGGLNIAAEKGPVETLGNPKVSAEWVLEKNPDIIIKYVGRNLTGWESSDLKKLQQIRQEILSRPGLKETNAVKNHRVYLVFDTVTCAPRGAAGLYYLARWFHPQLFQDIQPEEVHREMMKRFYQQDLEGVWVYPD